MCSQETAVYRLLSLYTLLKNMNGINYNALYCEFMYVLKPLRSRTVVVVVRV